MGKVIIILCATRIDAGLTTYAQFHPITSTNRVKCLDRTPEFEVASC